MPSPVKSARSVFSSALSLKQKQRAELALRLLGSLEPQPDPKAEAAWTKEIERRAQELDDGKTKTVSWSKVDAELGRRLRQIRNR